MAKNTKSRHEKNKTIANKELYDSMNKAKKEENRQRTSFLENLSSKFKIPSDILAGAPIITAIGKSEVCVENYKGIIEYNTTQIKILTKIGRVEIEGKNLNISYFTNDEMKILGMIQSISYINEKP